MWNNERDRTQILAGIEWAVRIGKTLGDAGRSLLDTARDAMGADACSVFVLDAAGDELRGARGTWDWTRSSFGARLEHWPNVRAVIESQIPAHVNGNNALGGEVGWFETRGIAGCLCTPLLSGGATVGVMFWDYTDSAVAPREQDSRFAQSVAASWAIAAMGVQAGA